MAVEARPEEDGRLFPCEGCGADLRFHVGVQKLECPYCGHTEEIEIDPEEVVAEQDLEAMLAAIAERKVPSTAADVSEVDCDACGATVAFTGTLTSTECPYCGVPTQRANVHDALDRVPVDGVLPFQLPREQAREALARWVRSRWFAPADFKKRAARGEIQGVYLPYWTFDAMTATRWTGQRGDHYTVTVGSGKNRRQKRRTRWSRRAGSFQRFFDDVLIVAGRGLPDKWLDRLAPWPLERCVPFDESLLAGFLARTYDVELPEGFAAGRQRMDAALEADVRAAIGGDVQRIEDIDSRYAALTYKHVLLPVWMLAYRSGDRSYQIVVNAATGEVQGERPWDATKIALLVVAALVVFALVWWFA